METTTLRYFKLVCTAFVAMAVCHVQDVRAGWTGLINGAGTGWASVNVRSFTANTNKITTPSLLFPSASIAPTNGYAYVTNSPRGASSNTYSRIKGLSGGIWQARTYAATGDGADNLELESRLKITPATCASLDVDTVITQQVTNESTITGTIEVTTLGTKGTALWLRGFEYTGDQSLLPPDDPNTIPNETIEFLKIHGTWKFETLIEGPFNFGGGNGTCPLLIPFTLNTTNIENLIFAVDGVAKSTPFEITCPDDVTFECGQKVEFPAASVTGGCGQISGTWSPEEDYAFPVGTTPVTVTVTDGNGDTAECTFNVIITDTAKPVSPALPNLIGQCSVTPVAPVGADACSGSITGKTTTTFPITAQGTTVVTWTFDDGHGNVTTTNQNVMVDDVTAPVQPTLADLTFAVCNGTPAIPPTPTTTDNCKGTVSGTTTTTFPITTAGTNVVTWVFDDGNGNQTSATQRVILTGLTFSGFYAPINGAGGTCAAPLVVKSSSSTLPIKFDIKCGTSLITGGTPPVVHIQPFTNCVAGSEIVVANAEYQNDWHYNWSLTGRASGIYKITIVLPDGSSQFVFVRLK